MPRGNKTRLVIVVAAFAVALVGGSYIIEDSKSSQLSTLSSGDSFGTSGPDGEVSGGAECQTYPIIATTEGELPVHDPATVGEIALPPGALKGPDADYTSRTSEDPALWISNDQVDSAIWVELSETFYRTGLWPVLLTGLSGPEDPRPWDEGEFDPQDVDSIDAIDADAWLLRASDELNDSEFAEFAPVAPLESLAEAESTCSHTIREVVSDHPGGVRLGLIPAKRPADVITEIGWQGAINHVPGPAPISAVLRSWEDRFGAYVVSIGFDTLTIVVQNTPTDPVNLERFATELYLLCPDVVDQGVGSVDALTAQLAENPVVTCWWD